MNQTEKLKIRLSCTGEVARSLQLRFENGQLGKDVGGVIGSYAVVTPGISAWKSRIEELIEQKDPNGVVSLADQMIRENPFCSIAWDAKAIGLYEQYKALRMGSGRDELLREAINCGQRAVELDGSEAVFRSHLSVYLYDAGRVHEAELHAESAVKISPADGYCWNNYGLMLLRSEKVEQGMKALDRARLLGFPVPVAANESKAF